MSQDNLPQAAERPPEGALSPEVNDADQRDDSMSLVQVASQGGDVMAALELWTQKAGVVGRIADRIAHTSSVPQAYRGKPDEVFSTMMQGMEIGLLPFQALRWLADIYGNKALHTDGPLALCKRSPVFEDIREVLPDMSEADPVAKCYVKRRNSDWVCRTFSKSDATRAGLWGKKGSWTQYPQRMLMFRARSWALRDTFPDVLSGIGIKEEMSEVWQSQAAAAKRPEVRKPMGMEGAKAALSKPEQPPAQSDAPEAQQPEQGASAPPEPASPPAEEPGPTPEQIEANENALKLVSTALNMRQLDAVVSSAGDLHPDHKAQLRKAYSERRKALRKTTQAAVMEVIHNAAAEDDLAKASDMAEMLKEEHAAEVVRALVSKREALGLNAQADEAEQPEAS